jgi:hypothetical protein
MARGIQNFPNIETPDDDYPNGRVKDNAGAGDGTPLNEFVLGDFQQFFAKIMREAGITPNGLPDNEYSGNQYYQALLGVMKKENTTFFKNSPLTVFSSVNLTGPAATGNFVRKNNIINGTVQVSGVATATGSVTWILTLPTGFVLKTTKVGEDDDHSLVGIVVRRVPSSLDTESITVIKNGVDVIDAAVDINNRFEVTIGTDAEPTMGDNFIMIVHFTAEAIDD